LSGTRHSELFRWSRTTCCIRVMMTGRNWMYADGGKAPLLLYISGVPSNTTSSLSGNECHGHEYVIGELNWIERKSTLLREYCIYSSDRHGAFQGQGKRKEIFLFLVRVPRHVGLMKGNNSRVTACTFFDLTKGIYYILFAHVLVSSCDGILFGMHCSRGQPLIGEITK
jgi:hypothetical protein